MTDANKKRGFKDVLDFLRKHKDVLSKRPKSFQLSHKELEKIMSYNKPFVRESFLRRLVGIERKVIRMNNIRTALRGKEDGNGNSPRNKRRPAMKSSFRAPCGRVIWRSSEPSAILEVKNWPDEEDVFLAPCYRPIQCVWCMKEREDAYLICLNVAAKNYWEGWVMKESLFGKLPLPKVNNLRRLIIQSQWKKGEGR